MAREILISVDPVETRAALVAGGALVQLRIAPTAPAPEDQGRDGAAPAGVGGVETGDIILARVVKHVAAIDAVFCEIGAGRAGFLPLSDARMAGLAVHEGAAIVLQVAKPPASEKGAKLTANVTLAGRLLVAVPRKEGVSLSKRITDAAERARLTAALEAPGPDGMGFVVRTSAFGASAEALQQEAGMLRATWAEISTAAAAARPPQRLHRAPEPALRAVRDWLGSDVTAILCDDAATARRIATDPGTAPLLRPWAQPKGLFAAYGIEDMIEGLLRPRVRLPGGGWITIEATEALTAIDINSGEARGPDAQATARAVNLAAAAAIGREIVLRGLGGLIVIDAIHTADPQGPAAMVPVLAAALSEGKAPFDIATLDAFGIVAITRRRGEGGLGALLTEPCPGCTGGRRLTAAAIAARALRRVAGEASARPSDAISLRVHPDVAGWLAANDAAIAPWLDSRGLAADGHGRLRVVADPALSRDGFDAG